MTRLEIAALLLSARMNTHVKVWATAEDVKKAFDLAEAILAEEAARQKKP